MKHYLDLIPIVDKAHRRQRLMTKLCIVLSVFLVTAIFGMADMEMRSQYLQITKESGNWHMMLSGIDDETAAIIATRPEVQRSGWYTSFGSDEDALMGKPLHKISTSADALENIFLTDLVEGTYPKQPDEIVLTRNAKDQLGLRVGEAVVQPSPTGGTQTLVITGFMANTAKLLASDAFGMLFDESAVEAYAQSAHYQRQFLIQFSKHADMRRAIEAIRSQFGLSDDQVALNTKLLGVLGQSDYNYMKQLYLTAVVLGVVVLMAGVMMIASNLNSDIRQRTSFFGMLRCLGATKRQVMRFVQLEALSWCKTAIPIGILLGTVITWVLSALLKWLTPIYFDEMPTFAISWVGVIAGIAIGLISVLAASRAPARKAAQVSPLTAVMGNAYIEASAKSPKSTAKMRHLKVDTTLGVQHAFSVKKNYALMLGSFGLSIILFLCFSATIAFLNHAIEPLRPWSQDIIIRSTNGDNKLPSALIDQIRAEAHVKNVYGSRYLYDKVAEDGSVFKIVTLNEAQWSQLRPYQLKGSVEVLQSEHNAAVLLYSTENTMTTGDTVNIDGVAMKITGVVSDSPVNATDGVMTLLCSEATFNQLDAAGGYERIDIQLERRATDADVAAIRTMVDSQMRFSDDRLINRQARGAYYSMALFIYGFLLVIAMITLLNIVNGISISAATRIRQYGIMRAIGMTDHQMVRMIRAETLTYAVSGSIFGCIAGLPLHRWLYGMMVTSYWGTPWQFPFGAVATIVILVLLTSAIAVYGPSKRIHAMSVVDTIAAL